MDPFHRNQAIVRNVSEKKARRQLISLFNCGNVEEWLQEITELLINNNTNKKGSHYLAKILTESTNKRVSSILDNYNNIIEDQVINEIKETIQLSAKDVNKGINKGLGSEIKKCSLPYEGCALNEG